MRVHSGEVVVVDDDGAFRALLIDVLERAGYDAVGAASAEEALAAISEHPPDVALVEVKLPGISGYELCRQLKDAYGQKLAVIIVSGERTEPFDRAAGIFLGADDYMIKPIDPSELLARVWRLVTRSNSRPLPASRNQNRKLDLLSTREREVLDLLAGGSRQEEIAEALLISSKTVATYIQRILVKLGVHSRTHAVALALTRDRDTLQGIETISRSTGHV